MTNALGAWSRRRSPPHHGSGAVLSHAPRAEAVEDDTLWTIVAAAAVVIGVLACAGCSCRSGESGCGGALVRRRRQLHLHLAAARDVDLERLIVPLRATLLPDARSALGEPDLALVVCLSTGGRRGRAPRVV